jgi:hypothetical protein
MPELTRRYVVMPLATDAPFDAGDRDGAFVLKPWKDPAALRALRAYADCCYPELARDLQQWIRTIEREPAPRGDVGRRNEEHLGRAPAPRRAKARPARKTTRAAKKRRRS